jgi:hypothetical protein
MFSGLIVLIMMPAEEGLGSGLGTVIDPAAAALLLLLFLAASVVPA